MSRRLGIILLASILVACSSPPAAKLPSPSPFASQSPTPPVAAAMLPARATPVALPVAPLPANAASSQPDSPEPARVTGTINIDARRPIPPAARLAVQLHRVNRDGVSTYQVLDEQRFPIQATAPIAFELTYTQADLAPPAGGNLPFAYRVFALLHAPGRVSWIASVDIDLQQPIAPLAVTLAPPPNVTAITGTVLIPAEPRLPPDAVLTVRLAGLPVVYYDDLPAQQDLIVAAVQPGKLPFTLEYRSGEGDHQRSYQVQAEVRSGGKLPLVGASAPVVEQPQAVEVIVAPPREIAAFTGTISYTAQSAPPADARLTVEIREFLVSESPPHTVAAYTTPLVGPAPIPFALEYDPAIIDRSQPISVAVRVASGDKILFEQPYSLPPNGEPVEIVLENAN